MIYRKPAFYDQFHCIASACTDTCCAGWEIEVDETTAGEYLQEPGAFGDRLRSEIEVTEEECYFRLKENRCPFLNRENLCDIVIHLGEDRLCDICREHPRFYNWFGNCTEVGIGLCCEEAERLLFSDPEKLTFLEEELPEETFEETAPAATAFENQMQEETASEEMFPDESVFCEHSDAWPEPGDEPEEKNSSGEEECRQMLEQRDGMIFILQNRSFRMGRRLLHLLDYGMRLEEMENPPADSAHVMEAWRRLIRLFAGMEALDEVWPSRMARLEAGLEELFTREREFDAFVESRSYEYEHFAVYLAYRYLPQSLFDGCVLSKAEFIVAAVLLVYLLGIECFMETGNYTAADRDEIIRRFSKEIEYCPENLETFEAYCSEHGRDFVSDLAAMVRMVRS